MPPRHGNSTTRQTIPRRGKHPTTYQKENDYPQNSANPAYHSVEGLPRGGTISAPWNPTTRQTFHREEIVPRRIKEEKIIRGIPPISPSTSRILHLAVEGLPCHGESPRAGTEYHHAARTPLGGKLFRPATNIHDAANTPPRGKHSTTYQRENDYPRNSAILPYPAVDTLPRRGRVTARWNDQCAMEPHHAANTPPRRNRSTAHERRKDHPRDSANLAYHAVDTLPRRGRGTARWNDYHAMEDHRHGAKCRHTIGVPTGGKPFHGAVNIPPRRNRSTAYERKNDYPRNSANLAYHAVDISPRGGTISAPWNPTTRQTPHREDIVPRRMREEKIIREIPPICPSTPWTLYRGVEGLPRGGTITTPWRITARQRGMPPRHGTPRGEHLTTR